jgi:hypothetical protein
MNENRFEYFDHSPPHRSKEGAWQPSTDSRRASSRSYQVTDSKVATPNQVIFRDREIDTAISRLYPTSSPSPVSFPLPYD